MSDDQPSSAAVNPLKRLAMRTRTYSTSAPGETHTATTETDSQWLPNQDYPKDDPTVQKPWEPGTADFCTTRPQLRHCSQNEVVKVEFAVSVKADQQLLVKPVHAATQSNEMGEHTEKKKEKIKSESSLGRLRFHRSAVGIKTHCITNGVTTWSSTLLDCGKITWSASVQSRCKHCLFARSVGDQELRCEPVA